jgi:hypothetical protein
MVLMVELQEFLLPELQPLELLQAQALVQELVLEQVLPLLQLVQPHLLQHSTS